MSRMGRLAVQAVRSELVSVGRLFPEPRENTGKSSTFGPHISKLARANAWNPACLGLIPCRSEQGIFPGEQRNITESGSGRQVQIRGGFEPATFSL